MATTRLTRMARGGLACLVLCMVASAAPAHAADELDSLIRSYDDAVRVFIESTGQGNASIDLSKHPANVTLPKVQAYAESNAGKPEAIPALVWMLKNSRNAAGIPSGGKVAVAWAVDRLQRDHVADPAIIDALPTMRYLSFQLGNEPLLRVFRAVADKNPDKATRALALYNIAQTYFISPTIEIGDGKTETPRQRAKAILKTLVKDYAGTPAAAEAEALIKTTQGTGIGMEAPDIVGPDADGKEIRLSQFQGQVVLLHFWGFW